MSENNSYSIYIDRRPTRSLYVINSRQLTFEKIDEIIEHNIRKWGGRYNLILPVKSSGISNDQWIFLKKIDPDFVKLYIPTTKKLAIDLDTKITPIQVMDGLSERNFSARLDIDGISILPTPRNIALVSNSALNEPTIVLFNIENCQDEVIKKFIERNFGLLDIREMSNHVLNRYTNKKIIEITDKPSFISALESFNDYKPYVFPIQLCSIGDSINDDRSIDDEKNFYVFIGDSPLDLLDCWNNPFYLQSWTRTYLRQIWLPTLLAEDVDLQEPLKKFIHGRADPYGNGQRKVVFSSRTIKANKLNTLATLFTNGAWVFKETKVKKYETYPNYSDYFSFDLNKVNMVHLRGTGNEEKVTVPSPEIEEGVMGGQYWMNDLYVQLPERKVVPINFETWLQLPKNNSVAHTIVPGMSRMTKNGIPSILTSRSNQFRPDTQEFILKLPGSRDIFASIILNSRKTCFNNDVRKRYNKPYKYTISRSSAGKQIHGFLEVFGSLENTYQILEKRYWRTFFDLMANVSPDKEEKRLNDIKVRLQGRISSTFNSTALTSTQFIDWLSRELQKTAKVYIAANPKAVPFSSLEKIIKDEVNEYNTRNPSNTHRCTRDSIKESLRDLTDSGAVLIGYELTCPSCLNKEWRALNEINQTIECRGCSFEYPFTPETEMKYKLNSVIENGIRNRGVIPVALGLGSILNDASNYFDFLPPVDIYKKSKLITDLDICCVKDGQFIIGEVKAQQDLFHPSDFEKITNLAKEIHPDKVVFCSLDQNTTQRINGLVQNVKQKLLPYEIEVEWLHFDQWIFESSPIY